MSEQTSTILLRKLAEAERDDPVLAPELRSAADEIEQLRESVTRLAKAVSDRESETLAVAAEVEDRARPLSVLLFLVLRSHERPEPVADLPGAQHVIEHAEPGLRE